MSTFISSLYQVPNPERKPEDIGLDIKEMFKEPDDGVINNDDFLKKILSYFRLRLPFEYGYSDLMRLIFCCRCIMRKKNDNEALYLKGS
jgi:hypothetical protein